MFMSCPTATTTEPRLSLPLIPTNGATLVEWLRAVDALAWVNVGGLLVVAVGISLTLLQLRLLRRQLMLDASRIDLRRIMDEGQIVLIDLSTVGGDLAEILGAFILSLLLSTAISRSNIPEQQRKGFAIFADEAHRFVASDAIENIIVQARKFGIDLCLAHQYLSQFGTSKVDALSTAGCTILGRVDKRDSAYFAKDFFDLVDPKDIMRLNKFEMIARIGREVVRFKTHPTPQPPAGSDWKGLIAESRRKYCRPVEEVRAELARRSERWNQPQSPLSADIEEWHFTEEDLAYDEW